MARHGTFNHNLPGIDDRRAYWLCNFPFDRIWQRGVEFFSICLKLIISVPAGCLVDIIQTSVMCQTSNSFRPSAFRCKRFQFFASNPELAGRFKSGTTANDCFLLKLLQFLQDQARPQMYIYTVVSISMSYSLILEITEEKDHKGIEDWDLIWSVISLLIQFVELPSLLKTYGLSHFLRNASTFHLLSRHENCNTVENGNYYEMWWKSEIWNYCFDTFNAWLSMYLGRRALLVSERSPHLPCQLL